MKKYMILACTMVCLSIFADSTINSETGETFLEDMEIVNLCDLTEDDLLQVTQGLHPDKIIEFSANTTLPIDCYLRGDLINLVQNVEKWGVIEIKQTFYARCTGKELLFSSDLTEWKPLLEFITGEAFVILSLQDGQTFLAIGTELIRRT
ncbi:hypothetical protein RHABOEDO_000104 [Candidatus Rhabdochlamydia oedothoracis]|uniref:Uncharacterized protein n=1 Tax=Candidatus Rhabdochlamydia oedothoracis TaxID=2720720 RepID=A0ABX8UYH9_9BACT|nr:MULTISPECIES: hypothetical protein [Rhabdochlamydia]KAG6559612.1 hypothetical protein RHOW815_000368 [Candidatus Rhabdochlamydia sp. W815]MCL6755655.1 hypothetical protein [Candidatus Rhabdochlamydia oedothoracis]QYF48015.1 hypothetical protein RHABOEDO_000104 [Candidatus Rhabdochlamydia oedothoracis]